MKTPCALIAMILAASVMLGAQITNQIGSPSQPQPTFKAPARFAFVDVFVDSGAKPLAAYQAEVTAHLLQVDDAQSPVQVTIVGVEGGDHAAFSAAPYYDPAAIQGERVIIGALSTLPADQLPTGKVRVARIHVMTTGTTADPLGIVNLTTAAGPDAAKISAEASWTAGSSERK